MNHREIKKGVIIPVYRHGAPVYAVVKALLSQFSCPIIIVDDGSDDTNHQCLVKTAEDFSEVVLITHEKNKGKGAACMSGLEAAYTMNLSHVLQIDADGQHDAFAAAAFFEKAAENPDALICGYPCFDESVPNSRKKGREFANNWTRFVTLSPDIVDALCGFRIYPVDMTRRIIHRYHFDNRMGFDIEILVRLHWAEMRVLFFPVNVIYPKDGISNFHLIRDNIRISWVFTRLCFIFLVRWPSIIFSRRKNEK